MDDTGQGRLAVVIGGGNGIGAATARLLADRGWRLAIIDRDLDAARATATDLHARAFHGDNARAFHGDVTDAAVMHGLAQEIEATVAPPYALVVSSGTFQDPVPPGRTALEDWDRIMRVNLDGVFFANRAFGPGMAARRQGSIVNIASIIGLGGTPLHAYGPTKAAVINLTESLAGEWGRAGVRVNAVSPGVTLVPRVLARRQAGGRYRGDPAEHTALGRCVEPSEVAETIEFLLSDRASAITGVNLTIDCGWAAARGWVMYGGVRPVPGD
jgi:NAD(P)-dependent dehydrogenase (short-subunit alcohol dehydrogenase family)